MSELISIKRAMNLLGVKSYNTFKANYLNSGLPMVVVNKNRKIDMADLRKFVNEHKEVKQNDSN